MFAHPRHCHKDIRKSQLYSLRRDLILESYSLFAVWCEIFGLFYIQHESLSLLRKYLKELVESDCLAVEGKLFHALTVGGKNEL